MSINYIYTGGVKPMLEAAETSLKELSKNDITVGDEETSSGNILNDWSNMYYK